MKLTQKTIAVVMAMTAFTAFSYSTWTDSATGYRWTYYILGEEAVIYNETESFYGPDDWGNCWSEFHSDCAISPKPTGAVTIPATLGGKPVTSIGESAFSYCSGLTSVTIPDSVTSIESSAFGNCSGLMSISVGPGNANYKSVNGLLLSKDGKTLVHGVNGNVTIPNSVTTIGDRAFSGCSGLTSVTIPNSVTTIGDSAFSGCSGLKSVTIPDSVTTIGYEAFYGCSGLTSVHITDLEKWCGISFSDGYYYDYGDRVIDCYANPLRFAHNLYLNDELLTELTILDSVTSIGSWAFYGCSGLTSVTIPNSVTNIGVAAFRGCSGLTSVTIPNSVTSIGSSAFRGCSGLTSVTIPNSVTSIGSSAFRGCSGLTSVYITDLAKWCGISFGSSYDANPLYYAHNLYLNGVKVTALTIPSSVTSIGAYAFYNCSGLTSVTIPNSVTNIGASAFYECTGLTSVTIPNSVTNIGYNAFSDCSGLTSVTILDGVTTIGDRAFSGCSGLTSVTIPNSVTSIGDRAFDGCSGLTSVTIPSRWTLSAIFPGSYSRISSVMIPSGSTAIADYAFKGCGSLTSISIPDSVTSIGDEAFYNCASLENLAIPDSVMDYGVNCFEGCPAYTRQLYRAVFGGNAGGGSATVVTTVVQNVEAPYALADHVADRAIASVTVDGDCAIDSFVLKDGKVYDSMLYVSNTADHVVALSLPSGFAYKTIKGATPLAIPASSQCLISITRVDVNVFLVMREELDDVK